MRIGLLLALAACGDPYNGTLTPEKAAGAPEGHLVVVIGTVFGVTFDSTEVSMHMMIRNAHAADPTWTTDVEETEEARPGEPAYEDTENYHRTPDHYVLIRSTKPPGVTNGDPDFTPGALAAAWGLGIHLTDIDAPSPPMPELGARIEITGTVHHETWNSREIEVPIVEDATITVLDGPPELGGPGDACTRDTQCNARLVCDRVSTTCVPTPHEIYWADPWRDVNGACDTDADCPLGQVCDASHVIASTGNFAAVHATTDAGRHLCTLAPGATLASECARIYTARDLVGGRFASGKEICVRGNLLTPLPAADNDTHDQIVVDEPIPYPTADATYAQFGAVTENGPVYKDPALPGGPVNDPVVGQDVVAIGTYRYDMGHGWYEVHPVKAYFAPPAGP